MTKIDIYELESLVTAIVNHPARSGAIPGCDCGCGGDDDWTQDDEAERDAIECLLELGLDVR